MKRGLDQIAHELQSLVSAFVVTATVIPVVATCAESGARWVDYEEVPLISWLEQVKDVSLIVTARNFAGKQIT